MAPVGTKILHKARRLLGLSIILVIAFFAMGFVYTGGADMPVKYIMPGDVFRITTEWRIVGRVAGDWNKFAVYNSALEPVFGPCTEQEAADYVNGKNPIGQCFTYAGNLRNTYTRSNGRGAETDFLRVVLDRMTYELADVSADKHLHALASFGLFVWAPDSTVTLRSSTGLFSFLDTYRRGMIKEMNDRKIPEAERQALFDEFYNVFKSLEKIDSLAASMQLDDGDLLGDLIGDGMCLANYGIRELKYGWSEPQTTDSK